MISLEQVRALEDRVEKAVAYIARLREEGAELGRRLAEAQSFIDSAADEVGAAEAKAEAVEKKLASAEKMAKAAEGRLADMAERVASAEAKLAASEARAAELSARADEYRRDQAKIEEGIVHALEKLDSFEDLVLSQAVTAPPSQAPASNEVAPALDEAPAPEVAPAQASVEQDSGIAIKAAPEPKPESEQTPPPESLENELDIF
jgi:chromosome segregation ATPase